MALKKSHPRLTAYEVESDKIVRYLMAESMIHTARTKFVEKQITNKYEKDESGCWVVGL